MFHNCSSKDLTLRSVSSVRCLWGKVLFAHKSGLCSSKEKLPSKKKMSDFNLLRRSNEIFNGRSLGFFQPVPSPPEPLLQVLRVILFILEVGP